MNYMVEFNVLDEHIVVFIALVNTTCGHEILSKLCPC